MKICIRGTCGITRAGIDVLAPGANVICEKGAFLILISSEVDCFQILNRFREKFGDLNVHRQG